MKCPTCGSTCARIFKPRKGWRCIVCWVFYLEGEAMRRDVAWDEVIAIVQAQPPGVGAEAMWEAIGAALQVSRVLFSQAQQDRAYRIDAVGFLPAVLVVPRDWRAALPPVPAAWAIPAAAEG
jgi:hypothetical protein